MISKLLEGVDPAIMGEIVIVLMLFFYALYKEWPEFRKRVTSGVLKAHQMEETDATLAGRLDKIELDLGEVNQKLDRDYRRLNEFERWQRRTQAIREESAEEMALMMEGMLGCLDGMVQLGADGDTEKIRAKLNSFMIKASHKGEEIV